MPKRERYLWVCTNRRPDGHPDNAQTKRVAVRSIESKPAAPVRGGAMAAPVSVSEAPAPAADYADEMEVTSSVGRGSGSRYKSSRKTAKKPAKEEPPRVADKQRVATGDQKMKVVSSQLVSSDKIIVIEGYADANRAGAETRANLRNRRELIRSERGCRDGGRRS